MSNRRHLTLYLDARESWALEHRPVGTTEHGWIVSLIKDAIQDPGCDPISMEKVGPTARKLSLSLPESLAVQFQETLEEDLQLPDAVRYLLYREAMVRDWVDETESAPDIGDSRKGRETFQSHEGSRRVQSSGTSTERHKAPPARRRIAGARPVTEDFGIAFDTRFFRIRNGFRPRPDEDRKVMISDLDEDGLLRLARVLDGLKVGDTVEVWFGMDSNHPISSGDAQAVIWRRIVDEAWAASDSHRGFNLDGRHYLALGEYAFRVTITGT